ncbi:uncharacterized protein LOC110390802, partial [Numida meleagris]|uniref:uncharacterized protein LOC110390802 n=1 Tax=Numida meleagris TaxID=8996 RepID=UPI000B3DDD3A
MGGSSLPGPGFGEPSGCRVPGQQHATRSRCRDSGRGNGSAAQRSTSRHAALPPAPLAGELQAGSCFLLYRRSTRSRSQTLAHAAVRQAAPHDPKSPDRSSSSPATRAQAPTTRSKDQPRVTPAKGAALGRSCWQRRGGGAAGGAEPGLSGAALRGQRSGGMWQCRAAGLAGLVAVLVVYVSRAQVQQEPSAETSEGTAINITCSHPNIQSYNLINWYRQLPGRGPAFIEFIQQGSKEVRDPAGRLRVSADRRSSALWLTQPRLGDAAVYYCALDAQRQELGLRPGTNCGGRGGAVPGGAVAQSRPGPQGALPLLP